MVVGLEVKVPACVGLLTKHRSGEGVLIPLHQHVQVGQLILLYLHCELYLNVLPSEAVYHMSYAQNQQMPIYRCGNESLLYHLGIGSCEIAKLWPLELVQILESFLNFLHKPHGHSFI